MNTTTIETPAAAEAPFLRSSRGALTLALLLLARYRGGLAAALGLGVAWGGLAFLNPAPAILAPLVAAVVWKRGGRRSAAGFCAAALAVCAPWMVRNDLVLGSFSLRPNFGVELRIGNHDDADGHPQPTRYHPSHVGTELALYRELGEAGYARENSDRALKWIASNPSAFAALTAKRIALFWLGEPPPLDPRREDGRDPARDPSSWVKFLAYLATELGAAAGLACLRGDQRACAALALGLFGVPYYLTHVSERYRFPIEPAMLLLAALALVAAAERWQRRREARA